MSEVSCKDCIHKQKETIVWCEICTYQWEPNECTRFKSIKGGLMNREKCIELAAQAWCTPTTEHLDMIPELSEVFAGILERETKKAKIEGLEMALDLIEDEGFDNKEAIKRIIADLESED